MHILNVKASCAGLIGILVSKALIQRSNLIILVLLFLFLIASCSDNSPSGPENHAPELPTLGGHPETPADNATGVALVTTLSWSAVDSDNDSLTFSIQLGSTPDAGPVVEGLTSDTYTTDSLLYGTTYYWNIMATDPAGATSASDTWTFTTLPEPLESIVAPNALQKPIRSFVDYQHSLIAREAQSNLGHYLEFQFDWGDRHVSTWGSSVGSHTWDTVSTFLVKARARCLEHPTVVSEWSIATSLSIIESILRKSPSRLFSDLRRVGSVIACSTGRMHIVAMIILLNIDGTNRGRGPNLSGQIHAIRYMCFPG